MARESKTILFLCTGNYYRSRYAEVFFNAVSARFNMGWKATSRALALETGTANAGPMAKSAIEACKAQGIGDPAALKRAPGAVTEADLTGATRIVAMSDAEHRPMVLERHPGWDAKIEYWSIDDAPGVLPPIEEEVNGLVARLLGGGVREIPAPIPKPEPPKKILTLKVGRETKGRRGKGVTTIFEIPLSGPQIEQLAATLKNKCGTGGTVKDGVVEIQGDMRDRVCEELEKLGYRVKRVGG